MKYAVIKVILSSFFASVRQNMEYERWTKLAKLKISVSKGILAFSFEWFKL